MVRPAMFRSTLPHLIYSKPFAIRTKSRQNESINRGAVMQSRITGTTMPVLEFALEPNETIISEAGELSWMSNSIQMMTHTQFGGGGGLFGVLKRVAGGGCVCQLDLAPFDRLIWPHPNLSY